MRYTTPINTLAVNSSGERQLEAHHLDDNFTAQDNAIQAITRALFAAGGVAKPGTVTLTGLNLRVQDRVGVTGYVSAVLSIADQTLDLTTLPAGKGTVVMTTDPVTVNRTYTDVVTQENLTDTMTVTLGRLYVMGAGTAGVTLDAGGYPVAPQNTVPVAHVTRTAGGATLDEVLNPAIQVNSSVSGPAGENGVSVTAAEINGSGHLILTLSDASTIDAGDVGGGGAALPSGGTAGQVLVKLSADDGDVGWGDQTGSGTGGTGAGGTLSRTVAGGGGSSAISSYTFVNAPSGGYPDSGGELTNGQLPGGSYSDSGWVGIEGQDGVIVLDLGQATTLTSLSAYVFGGGSGSIYSPDVITAHRSNDGVTWTQAGTQAYATDTGTGWETVNVTGTARYWRVTLARRSSSGWVFVGELRVGVSVQVTGLPAGYATRVVDPYGTGQQLRFDVVDATGRVMATAWAAPGDIWAYSE